MNKQGNDIGKQYRTGIYYNKEEDLYIIKEFINNEQDKYDKKIAVEVLPLKKFIEAEEYHQRYLKKNPNGYCHIDLSNIKKPDLYSKPNNIKDTLSDIQYKVTQENDTEKPFDNEYWNNYEKGIYVDVITGQPLFVSTDKFESGCGWPSFTKPINNDFVIEKLDRSFNMKRIEVRSSIGDSHLGHVFEDGPNNNLRYCINSAALKFIPLNEMESKGYKDYIDLVK
jgi:peptide methionine sulfoxide reductase msrA/msrB